MENDQNLREGEEGGEKDGRIERLATVSVSTPSLSRHVRRGEGDGRRAPSRKRERGRNNRMKKTVGAL